MLIPGLGGSVVQIASPSGTSGVVPYCCSEPSCPCEGGRAAKAALETKQLEENRDQIKISAEAANLLASERSNQVTEPITAQAPAPVAEIVPSTLPEPAYASIDRQASTAITNYLDTRSLGETNVSSRTGQIINDFA